jgi:hypothetical protein
MTEWQHMSTAPRDGTVVELMCTYGVAPWYGIYRWTDEGYIRGKNGLEPYKHSKPQWISVLPGRGSPFDESSLKWRPYTGEASNYVDPTGGQQDDMAYWRRAVATKHGLPTNYVEKG